jgi:hypothetical protein
MPSLNIEQFGDLLKTTLSKFHTPDYTNLITDLTDHPAAKQLIRKSMMRFGSGKNASWPVRMNTGNSFSNISITDHDQVNIVDGFVEATVNWRKSKVSYAFYEEEMTINRTPARLVDLIKSREDGAKADFVEGMENNFWRAPSASDTVTPLGLPYWCPKNATTGFNGDHLSGYSDVAGLDPATYERWNNYTAQYVAVTTDDLIRKARIMAEETNFKPMITGVPDLGAPGKKQYFANLETIKTFEDVADSRNDNLGPDVAKHDGQVMFRRTSLNYVPRLNEDTTNPLYQVDFNVFKIMVQNGWWQKRTVLAPYPGQRNVSAVFLDSLYNFICYNRRLLGVIATGTTYPS